MFNDSIEQLKSTNNRVEQEEPMNTATYTKVPISLIHTVKSTYSVRIYTFLCYLEYKSGKNWFQVRNKSVIKWCGVAGFEKIRNSFNELERLRIVDIDSNRSYDSQHTYSRSVTLLINPNRKKTCKIR